MIPMIDSKEDAAIRATLLVAVETLARDSGGLIPSDQLQKPIPVPGGKQIRLWDQSGIVTRTGLRGPIAIYSRRDLSGKAMYPDQWLPDGDLIYRYRSGGANVADNKALRNAFEEQLPLIHFEQQREGGKVFYWASFPVYVAEDFPDRECVRISASQAVEMRTIQSRMIAEPKRSYSERTTMYREHQKGFRASVLRAYNTRCAICQLEIPELIEAAHIIPDREENGDPVVPNGISLCKIHHASFDANILGIKPTGKNTAPKVVVRQSVLIARDGPMLLHGLQEMHDREIVLPTQRVDHPDNDRLETRFERFTKAC